MTDSTIRVAVEAWLSNPTFAEAIYGHISRWGTGGITDMSRLFDGARAFNEDIGAWDTSGVTSMRSMLDSASAFNQDIGDWAVHNVASMQQMLLYTLAFNQDVSDWAVDSVTDMSYMFYKAEAFNQDISGWKVNSVTNMQGMFYEASAFDQDLGGWAVQSVTRMSMMFYEATAFNQDLGWCVDDGVDLDRAFSFTKCVSTSCGVFQKDVIGICYSACLISNQHGHCVIHTHLIIIISIVLALFAGVGRYVHKRKNADETYAAAARRVLCRRGTKVRAVAPTTSEEAPALPASEVSVVDAPAAGIAPGELGTVVSVNQPPANQR